MSVSVSVGAVNFAIHGGTTGKAGPARPSMISRVEGPYLCSLSGGYDLRLSRSSRSFSSRLMNTSLRSLTKFPASSR